MIEVREGRLGKGVYATQVLEPGQLILSGWGPRLPQRTRHSFQVDHDVHILIPTAIELINHSCEPNCGVLLRRGTEALEIHTLRRIEPGEELLTDYATFESEIQFMTGPCQCGAPSCRGRVTGYWDLSPERRRALGPYVAPYLRELELMPVAG
ncbi:MAG: SET domain-containing protein-lysine N-methyltransferase [Acidimicrobiales bacterium]|nr:SET domain-containing protein-lysine N-methyltransferase [Acidimicrobiales bacterium]